MFMSKSLTLTSTVEYNKAVLSSEQIAAFKKYRLLKKEVKYSWLFKELVHTIRGYKNIMRDACNKAYKITVMTVKHNKTQVQFQIRTSCNASVSIELLCNLRKQIIRLRERRRESGVSGISKEVHLNSTSYAVVFYNQFGFYDKEDFIKKIRRDKIYRSKQPKTDETHIGIELEVISNKCRSALAELLTNTSLTQYISVTDDGSIRTTDEYEYAHEIRVCAPLSKIKTVVIELCATIAECCSVNVSCGMHVHLDMRNKNKSAVLDAVNNLVKHQWLLFAMQPKSRRDNQYARKTSSRVISSLKNNDTYEPRTRYRAVNLCSLSKHETIEIRVHAGTIDPTKINNWIDLLVSMAYRKLGKISKAVSTLKRHLGISTELQE